jgi:hypothetical protein
LSSPANVALNLCQTVKGSPMLKACLRIDITGWKNNSAAGEEVADDRRLNAPLRGSP